ncbi:glycosyltransferase family 4 protein [Microbacterium schleiferi]|uniref:glycosyltransferase family 4 protein n=1 Tax=Microbacterium schleiferi TaxID=69362 RepID=UPI001D17323A|nr:glycosyltransferase family 1 protein [Microbacterium schleiferi]MCC4266746.1 glycosyltransferase family 4 protein [Microbacterium schleiferi]
MAGPTGSRDIQSKSGSRKVVINGRFLCQPVTGVQRVAIEYLHAIDSLLAAGELGDIDVEVVVPASSPLLTTPALRQIKVTPHGRYSGHLWEQLELARYARGSDLICFGNVAPALSLFSTRTRVLTMVHDLSFVYFPKAYNWRFRWLYRVLVPLALRRSDVTVTVAEVERESILRHYKLERKSADLHVLQNGALREGVSKNTPLQAYAERAPEILYVGSLTRRKNAENLLIAASTLVEQEDTDFVVIGANGHNFSSAVGGAAYPPEFRFLGQIDDASAVYAHMRSARLFLFPSLYEASPLPPIEAMANGCPVVAADIPSIRERCGDAVLYCDPHRPESIAHVATELLTDHALWNQMQQRGLEKASQYSWSKQAQRLMAFLDDAAHPAGAPRSSPTGA